MTTPRYRFDEAQSYWRHAPSGNGKHDTASLAEAPDRELLDVWDAAFRSRFRGYPEEDLFLQKFAKSVGGERILSVGSGLGLHELFYAAAGATVTCADIVPSNLRVVERVAVLKGLPGVRTMVLGHGQVAQEPCDTLFVYGALMHMPRDQQRELLRQGSALLSANGRIVLMLYTWGFASAMCHWTSPDQFDPMVFGRASDPSVGAEHCPWADWHDDDAVVDLAGPGFHIAKKQAWNLGYFAWYELRRGPGATVGTFFEPTALAGGTVATRVAVGEFVAGDAVGGAVPGSFRTSPNLMHYAALSPEVAFPVDNQVNAIQVRVQLDAGSISVGLLDVGKQQFITSAGVTRHGSSVVRLLVERMPERVQVIVSNNQSGQPASSAFTVESAEFLSVAVATPPATSGRSTS